MAEFFRRIEKKYIINKFQYELIKEGIKERMDADEHGKSTICNLYLDTNNYFLIRRSLEKPVYKDKVRIRSYNLANLESEVYLEVKKKYAGVVGKRRIKAKLAEVYQCLENIDNIPKKESQVSKELAYYFKYYDLHPTAYITYDREAFYAKQDKGFRITFDSNIKARTYDLSLDKGIYGETIFDEEMKLMEIKTLGGIPMWFTKLMSELKIYPGHFSKYGATYLKLIQGETKTENPKIAI